MRAGGRVGAASAMARARAGASAIIWGMKAASGMFFQYFLGISDCIAFTIRRAGLKMFWK